MNITSHSSKVLPLYLDIVCAVTIMCLYNYELVGEILLGVKGLVKARVTF